ncbi:MAG TPA: methyltransferase domain-containing protein [Planctomycetes bacterium]|nr:methyltransferase domain-containing protein [Planctomycetota bacterium]
MALEAHVPEGFTVPPLPSDRAEFWAKFWNEQVTPWDLGRPHPHFQRTISQWAAPGRALVPGCGRGHDAVFLARNGYEVVAVDFASTPRPDLAATLERTGGAFVRGDALALGEEWGPFDLFLEHTFLGALPLARRKDWARLARRMVRPGGFLAGIVFPSGKPSSAGGPPFGLEVGHFRDLLQPEFELIDTGRVSPPTPERPVGERYVLFRRR